MKPTSLVISSSRTRAATSHPHRSLIPTLLSAVALCSLGSPARADHEPGFRTTVFPYAVSLSSEYTTQAIISAGDRVPHTRIQDRQFQMIGVPDGMGVYRSGHKTTTLLLNHELAEGAKSEPVVGQPLYRGAFVSKFVLNDEAEVLSGEVAYDTVLDSETGIVGLPARTDNTERVFRRFCSGTLAWQDVGFDRPIYLCGEESAAPDTFDTRGGLAVAIVNQQLITLPHLGRFQHENLPVRPVPSRQTVLVLMEDNGSGFDSQLYLYVGEKDRRAPQSDVLARNGLVGGKLYAFVPTTPGVLNESQFQVGTLSGKWVEIESVGALSESQLEAASDAIGAFGMIKAEDGAWSKSNPNEFFFNTTGDGANSPAVVGNHFGRTYRLNLNKHDITGPCSLSILYNADAVVAAGGDIALTPDNIDTSKDYLMVCEDGTGFSRTLMANRHRQSQIWRYDLRQNYLAEPVVSLVASGRDGAVPAPGVWETSGIINTERTYGRNSWLFTVQAHPPTAAPAPNTVEDGQIVLLRPTRCDQESDHDDND